MVIAMAATRKLQGEIDRCLKKVSEGVETFEDIWQKVHNATNTNQKEKYETDLKKEIKKLQRLRDQIKSWIASGEIKDKSTLVETRKLIETQMERFKVVERETKTKAYSKEGLGAAQKLDPTAREREELNNWLATSIDQMQIQMDQFESEIESLLAAKKKRHDKEKQERLDELKTFMDKHKFHMSKLETLLRMLDNLSVDVNAVIPNVSLRSNEALLQLKKFLSQVKKIKDDIDYYLESHQEPEFEDNEFLYDDIEGLEEQQALGNLALSGGGEGDIGGTPTSITSGNNSPVSPIHSSDSSSDPEKRRKSSDDSSKVVRPVAMKANHSPSPGSKAVGGRPGTPPKSMGTPNNSSPSSGLSNHVSSLSSLSSSPTQTHQNYQNALNNVKTLSHLDCVEQHNNNSNNTNSNSTAGLVASSPPNTLAKSSSNCVSLLATENGLNCSSNELLLDEEGVDEELSLSPPRLPLSPHGIPNGIDVSPPVSARPHSETSELLIDKDYPHHRTSLSPDRLLSNLSVSSISMAMMGLGNGGIHSNLSNHAGPPLPTNHVIPAVGSSVTAGLTTSGSLSGLLGGGVSVSSQNNSSSQLSQQQQLQQMQQQAAQPSLSQSANSRGETPTSMMDIARIQADQQQQILRFLQSTSTEGDTTMATLKSMAQDALDRSGLNNSDPSSEEKKTTEAHIPPLLGVTPLGPVPLQKEHQNQFQMLDSSHYHLPVPADSERMRQFLPRNPYPTPQHYPQVSILHHMTPQHPLTNSDTMEFFQRLSIETLFFIFYYLEGTKAQYLAAKVLKKQSWRFHTKYMMWFQRHEEPKVINEDFEQGTYIYFDIEKWGQRKKDGFVFEYKYLEDRDLS